MRYVARPIHVTAHRIVKVGRIQKDGSRKLDLADGTIFRASKEQQSRMAPAIGDYWVLQEDGYIYLNPAKVFERKYAPESSQTGPG